MERKVKKLVQGYHTVDGAGVHLVRVLGNTTVEDFDPFLMLDSFDSHNPKDYMEGFPFHPHRGIETVTYLIKGEMEHADSLGNKGVIQNGESQWMNAGSGIMHQEMPRPVDQILGLQLWINLPQKDKMSQPTYRDITANDIQVVQEDKATVHVVSGNYQGHQGVEPKYVDAQIFDVELQANATIEIPTRKEDNVFIFTIVNGVQVAGQDIAAKTAVLFNEGDSIKVTAGDEGARFIFFAGKKLNESVAWGGPIVMNTRAELEHAFDELSDGTFIKHNATHVA
ncbi:hypothetical protein A4S06_05610 [Erysipelotrichaceae bacterium MTC7]|nr:hypothetical protein A4S06_05610 [Erysipelotrichaceae bacterium MTC7]